MSCMAGYKDDISYCYEVQRRDEKNLCFAKVTGIRDYCDEIANKDEQNFCYVIVQ